MQFDRITHDPNRMNGQPCIRNLRIRVKRVLEMVAVYPDPKMIFEEFPEFEDEDIAQALSYAAAVVDGSIIDLRRVG